MVDDHDNPDDPPPDPLPDWLHAEVAGRLAGLDYRYTQGRRRLIGVLAGASRPITLPDILTSDRSLTQSSAYRNLEVLERSGAIRRVTAGGDHAHFELAEPLVAHHHHLICMGCGTIEDVELDAELERLVNSALADTAASKDFEPVGHNLDLQGHCAECKA